MAETALETGNLQPAQQMYEEALGINRDLHDRSEEAYALAGVARVLAYRGKASQAHDASRAALVIWRELGDKTSLAESTVTAAAVAGESGDRKVAIELLHDALVAGSELEQTTRILAGALLTDYLLTDDRLNEAELAYKEHVARGDLAALPQPSRILASIVEGRLRVARGEHQAGAEMLQEAASRARKLELRPSELKARLEYARVQSVRSPAAARRELTSLAREARVHGFVTLAGDAERILERLPR
jgi:ATP/maltotriose-dependent transcriptional regulator MalT